jgi:hypothetical protein
MTLDAAFIKLHAQLAQLELTFDNLLWAVVQGQPAGWSHVVIDHYDAATNDILGLLNEAKDAAAAGCGATNDQLHLAAARRALATCQDRFNQVWIRYYSELVSFERKDALHNLKRKGRTWATWVQGVNDALGQCPPPIYDVSQTLLRCWQDLVERASMLSISAQATSAGPQIYLTHANGPAATAGITPEPGVVSQRAE